MELSEILGVSCAKNYDNSSTVLLKSSVPLKIQRYRNANLRFGIVNNANRDYVAHGLLVGIAPGNTIVRTWEFSVPMDSKNAVVPVFVKLGDMVRAFDNMSSEQDGISFFMLLRSADMPKISTLVVNSLSVYDSPQESEVTFDDFPFKSQESGTDSYPRLLAYRFRAYESVYNAYYRDIRNNPFVVNGRIS